MSRPGARLGGNMWTSVTISRRSFKNQIHPIQLFYDVLSSLHFQNKSTQLPTWTTVLLQAVQEDSGASITRPDTKIFNRCHQHEDQ